ncbi:MAG: DNA/RNA helicase [Gordonia sp.]|uniref:DUF4011 domain-containing protein n=1 Tax=Gordonia sp. (in: high G+C Gram-positive bacteria) TaxID=84139 RepID=UPI000C62579B|nr:DUF4011 domain-containing protein [Gordonia sp. (in: high G+C Gram-positive bacteria)]MAU84673.1 DNA/RNA helicase [Gordonia sp. (in: high G+C Gram-positive bacteria)]
MSTPTQFLESTHTLEHAGLRIVLHAHPAINLALVHNGVPLITALEVINDSEQELTDLTASLHLLGNGVELAPSTSRTYDGRIETGANVIWDDFGSFLPQVDDLKNLNESYRATLTVTVSSLWTDTAQLTIPVSVLAHNEWFNAPIFYDSLAAFVQPNTRAVSAVLDTASDLLQKDTGDSSLGGYQSGPERAALIANAVYEALHSRRIRYIDPPASFENTGQKVRTTSQVLDERFGTCIDLTVTYAACLEAAGIRPLVWLMNGHAFGGFLREETTLARPSITEENALVNLVESGMAVPVDAIYYEDGQTGSFKAAIAKARGYFADPSRLTGVVGVTAARKAGLRPLPSADEAVVQQEPPSTETKSSSLDLPAELLAAKSDDDLVLDTRDSAPARVRKWKRSLLDLSTRNRLLNLRAGTQVIDLHVPSSGLALLDDLAHAGKTITLAPNDELSSIHQLQGARRAAEIDPALLLQYLDDDHNVYAAVTKDAYVRRFKGLSRSARSMLEETGSANLYLTLGALIHKTSSGTEARAPLFLLPVKITGGTGRSPFGFVVDTTGVATPNHCLVQWLRIKHNVTIEALETPKLDDSGIDIDHALRDIRAALVDNNLDLRVDEVATISICQFGTFGMWKDLDAHWDVLEKSPIVRHLTHHAGESFVEPNVTDDLLIEDTPVDEIDVPVPIPADGSQLRAVSLAAEGRTFVLEGPPGTGKSQTITNLIAHALSKGKTVLFVAEKQAALDVVKKRLTKIGLSDFTLDLHGKSQSPNVIREQLRHAIDNTSRYNENAWAAKLADFRSRYAPLADYPGKIHDRNGADESLWRAYESALAVGDGPVAPVPVSYVAQPTVPQDVIEAGLEQFSRAARSIDIRPGSPWSIVGPGVTASADDLAVAVAQLSEAVGVANTDSLAPLLRGLESPEEIAALLPQARRQLGRVVPDAQMLEWWRGVQYRSAHEALIQEISRLQQNCAPLLATFTPMFIESGDVTALTTQADDASKGMFGRKRRAEQFERSLAPYGVEGADLSPAAALPLLQAIPGAREHISRLHSQMNEVLGPYAPSHWNPLAPDALTILDGTFAYIAETAEFTRTNPASWALLTSTAFPDDAAIATLSRIADAWQSWKAVTHTTTDDLERWRNGRHWFNAWVQDNPEWERDCTDAGGRNLLGWSRMSGFLKPLREAGLNEYVHSLLTGEVDAAQAGVAFIRGAALTSVKERRAAAGLTIFDNALREGEIDDFVNAAATLRGEQAKALPAALLKERPFHAGGLRGEVGELRRQLDRKRGGATFRTLITRYGGHILAATPVMFVSPASLAQFVPPGSVTFDLVVFDEASQVPVPQAIGALGRGRSAVIVGDSQQMPPTAIGQVSLNDSDDADEDGAVVPEDLESILTECVDSGLPRLWLSWHYRSQDESLINFSNQKYYEGRLASLPSPGGDETAGVEWRRVDGHFNREDKKNGFRTNRVEAEAIVAEIRARLGTPDLAGQTIGVVTFNQQQQSLVQDLLEESGDPLVLDRLRPDAEEGIFVKNLENVQGDERDVILFTTAFSKKPGDPKLPLNFGPLSVTGGEKRFNVAVTRARRKVLIFTSFEPSDIDLSRTKSVGLAHLRAYLEMAGHGVQPGSIESTRRDTVIDPVQDAICAALRDRGYEVELNYGLSDFVLDVVVREAGSEHWQVALMLDGPRWAERPTVADRDLTPQLLEPMMHWGAALRVWLPEWIDAPTAVLDRIDAAVIAANERRRQHEAELEAAAEARAAAIEQTRANGALADDEPEPEDEPELQWESRDVERQSPEAESEDEPSRLIASLVTDQPTLSNVEDSERDWHGQPARYLVAPTAPIGTREDLDRVNSTTVRRTITDAVRETVALEGPIELDQLARRVGHRFGYDRLRANRKEFILSCVPKALVRSGELGAFAWPDSVDPSTWRGFRSTPEDMSRALSDIAREEIVNAMSVACRGRGLDDTAVMRETLALFGQRRLTQGNTDRLTACIAFGIAKGRLVRIDGLIRAGT